MGVEGVTNASRRDGIAFAALTVFAVVMYTIPSEWIPALSPLRLALISSAAAAVLVVARRVVKGEPFTFDGPRGVALIAFGALALASQAWSIAPDETNAHALELLKLIAIYLAMVNVITTPRRLAIFAGAMVLASLVTSWHVLDVYARGEGLIEGYRARWLGVYGDPNHMAMGLGIVVPLGVAFLVHGRSRLWMRGLALLAVGMAVAAIVVSYSRGGFIGLVVAVTVWVFLEKRKVFTLVAGAALALALLFFAPRSFWERNETVTDFHEDASAMGRIHAWEVASRMSADNPLVGVGAGAFRLAWPTYAPHDARTAYVAHNVYLDVVGELGFSGLLLFLVFTGGAAAGALAGTRSPRAGWMANGIAAAVAGYVVCSLFSGYTLSAHFYVLFGLAASAERVLRLEAPALPSGARRRIGSPGAARMEGATG